MKKKQVLHILPREVRRMVEEEKLPLDQLQEMRIRTGQPVLVLWNGKEHVLGNGHCISSEVLKEAVEYICNYSLYAFEDELRQGFVTIEGGHRVGICGQVIIEGTKVKTMKHISSINIRIAHEIIGCANPAFFYVMDKERFMNTLIISPPGCGKTTMLRDMIRQLSDGNAYMRGVTVGVVDERSEIGACYKGVAQNRIGKRTDILDGCPKAEGMMMMIRSMAPKILAIDEIGTEGDVSAIEYAIRCGVGMLATAHGMSYEDMKQKRSFEKLINEKAFERFIVLGNQKQIACIYNEFGERIG